MAKFNPNKIKAFQDFLELQNELKSAQSSYESVKAVEQIPDTFFGSGRPKKPSYNKYEEVKSNAK